MLEFYGSASILKIVYDVTLFQVIVEVQTK
jgi:hypothetical protein